MTLREIKKEMCAYRDYYNGDLMYQDEIAQARSKEKLAELIDRHKRFLQNMLIEAEGDLDSLKKRLGLDNL